VNLRCCHVNLKETVSVGTLPVRHVAARTQGCVEAVSLLLMTPNEEPEVGHDTVALPEFRDISPPVSCGYRQHCLMSGPVFVPVTVFAGESTE
jgi:hypothetical protein